jgi:hypothetical protein
MGAEWLALSEEAARLEVVSPPALDAGSAAVVVVSRRVADPLLTELRDQLPPAVALLAEPWERSNVLLVQTARLPSTAPRSLGELALDVAAANGPVRWHSVSTSAEVAERDRELLSRLVPGRPDPAQQWLEDRIPRVMRECLPSPRSRPDAVALIAGLLLIHDRLDASHQHSQSIEGEGRHRAGDYWHAILHRREPDYGNSQYWFRRVGRHPTFPDLARHAREILRAFPAAVEWLPRLLRGGEWDPFAFVDLCRECAGQEESPLGLAARRIQEVEMLLLLRQTWRDANGE